MKLVNNPSAKLYDIFEVCCRIVDENKTDGNVKSMSDKEYYRNIASLMKEIIAKYPKIIGGVSE
jgi:hypothetical protein